MRSEAARDQTEPAGLLSREGRPVPLEGVRITMKLRGLAAEMTVNQRFVNHEESPIEATYLFPLPEDASVCGFTVRTGERTIEGTVEERDKAFEIYDDAMAEGDGAFLLDQERPNVFHLSVGNVLPGQVVDVQIRLVSQVRYDSNFVRLMIPTTISPRYTPGDLPEEQRREIERITPPYAFDVPYGFSLEIDALLHSGITAVESPSHPIRSQVNDNTCRITLGQEEAALDRDVVVLLETDRGREAGAMVATRHGRDHVLLELYPRLEQESERKPRNVLFLVDCSGSMMGTSMEQAKRALDLCIRTLHEGDTFQIVSFGSTYQFMFRQTMEFSQKSLDRAATLISKMDADLGGTEILEPIKHITKELGEGTLDVVLLTDGQVANEAQVLAHVRKYKGRCRFFTFGIGAGSSEFLVKGLARESGGISEFIYPGERIEEKVLRQFARIDSPAVENVSIDWGGLKPEMAPKEIPPVYQGDALTVAARFEEGFQLPEDTRFTLKGKTASGPVSWSVAVSRVADDEAIPLLWARNRIRNLEGDFGAPRGSLQKRKRNRSLQELVDLSREYGILSSETSFVGVEERTEDEKSDQTAELRRVPVAVTTGWHGIDMVGASAGLLANMMHIPKSRFASLGSINLEASGDLMDIRCEGPAPSASDYDAFEVSPLERAQEIKFANMGGIDQLFEILRRQNADGSFPLSEIVIQYCGNELASLVETAQALEKKILARVEILLGTLWVLKILTSRERDSKDLWKAAAHKAVEWLESEERPDEWAPLKGLNDEMVECWGVIQKELGQI
jgi:Ca-activated chloride channel family protein